MTRQKNNQGNVESCINKECPLHPSRYKEGCSLCNGNNQYRDRSKFVTDPKKLSLTEETYVHLSNEKDFDIVLDLEDRADEFETLRPSISKLAGWICTLDMMAKRFNCYEHERKRPPGGTPFGYVWFDYVRTVRHKPHPDLSYELAIVYLEKNGVRLDYWGTRVATQFDVEFEYVAAQQDNPFFLRKFGLIYNIPDDWDKEFRNF